MTEFELAAIAEIGARVAREAGANLVDNRRKLAAAVSITAFDIKVEGDLQTEMRVAKALVAETGLAVFGEEAGWHGAGETAPPGRPPRRHWIIDPLDGTMNFSRRVPFCGVSMAIVEAGLPLFGIVYDFDRDELFMGGKSLGLTVNGVPARSTAVTEPPGAILVTGFPAAFTRGEESFTAFGRFLAPWRKVRMLGSASVMLAYAAAGRVDVYIEHNGRFWDVAGGLALMLAGGGEVQVSSTALEVPITTLAGPAGFRWPEAAYMGADPSTYRRLAW
jgi:myo-inositol-1(or 4)-monophosphatase